MFKGLIKPWLNQDLPCLGVSASVLVCTSLRWCRWGVGWPCWAAASAGPSLGSGRWTAGWGSSRWRGSRIWWRRAFECPGASRWLSKWTRSLLWACQCGSSFLFLCVVEVRKFAKEFFFVGCFIATFRY